MQLRDGAHDARTTIVAEWAKFNLAYNSLLQLSSVINALNGGKLATRARSFGEVLELSEKGERNQEAVQETFTQFELVWSSWRGHNCKKRARLAVSAAADAKCLEVLLR